MHLSASIGTGKAPMDAAMVLIALGRQGHDVLLQMIEALHTFGQTASLKNADLDLGHIEPLPCLGVPASICFGNGSFIIESVSEPRFWIHYKPSDSQHRDFGYLTGVRFMINSVLR
jgi:hypothetical protein